MKFVILAAALISSNLCGETGPSSPDMDNNKKEKRRKQNVEAAKKSYEEKKKVRHELQQKNTELIETQMQLIHEKSFLEERQRSLEVVMSSLVHLCTKDGHPTECQSRIKADGIANGYTVCGHSHKASNNANDVSDDNVKALDLSTRSQRRQSTHRTPVKAPVANKKAADASKTITDNGQVKTSETPNRAHVEQDGMLNGDAHIMDVSTLGLGATQEVEQVTTRRARTRYNKDTDIEVFIPEIQPKKSRKSTGISRVSSGCSTDVLKKQKKSGIHSHPERGYSTTS